MISRREFMAGSVSLVVASKTSREPTPEPEAILVNDIHSQLNSTRVLGISQPRSLEEVQRLVRTARKDRKVISVAVAGMPWADNSLALTPCCWISES